jgi:hypothetical protein
MPTLLLGLASGGLLVYILNRYHGAGAQHDDFEAIYWTGFLLLLAITIGCGGTALYGVYRRRNLNDAPLQMRLDRGKTLGLPLEEFEHRVKTEEMTTATPPVTHIQAARELPSPPGIEKLQGD